MRTRIKICGLTRLEDAQYAISSGADALGFVFYKPSPRYISPEKAADIIQELPPFVTCVGLFVDASRDFIESTIKKASIDLLQFHGDESESECLSYHLPYIKAIRVRCSDDVEQAYSAYPSSRALLLDTYMPGIPGGTGEKFDWDLIPGSSKNTKEIILAGGLNANNVKDAIKVVNPYAVDVSGGVELHKGIKDHLKIKKFVEEVSCV